jgi:hypothetical protein
VLYVADAADIVLAAQPEAEVPEEQAAYNNTENEHGLTVRHRLTGGKKMGV